MVVAALLLSGRAVYDMVQPTGGTVWVATSGGIWIWRDATLSQAIAPTALPDLPWVLSLSPDSEALWVGTPKGLWICEPISSSGSLRGTSCTHTLINDPIYHIVWDSLQAFLASPAGLILTTGIQQPREIGRLNRQTGIPLLSDTLTRLFLQGDSVLWVGTAEGLHRVSLPSLNQTSAWRDTFLVGREIRDILFWGDSLVVATDSGLWIENRWVYLQPTSRLTVEGDTLFFTASPAGLYALSPFDVQPSPRFPIQDRRGGAFVRTPEGWLWADWGGWDGLFPEEGNGLWLDTQRVTLTPTELPFRRVTDMVEDREGNLWGIFWNREDLPERPSGWVWVYLPQDQKVLARPLPQPFQLTPHPLRGVWAAHYRWGGSGNAGAYWITIQGDSLQVDSVDLGTDLVMALNTWRGESLVYGYYRGGSSGAFGIRIWEPSGVLRPITEGLSEFWRVEMHPSLQGCSNRIVAGSHGQGLWIFSETGNTLAHINTASGLPSDIILDAVCVGDTLWVLTDQGLARVERFSHVVRTLPLNSPVAMDDGLGALWILTHQELLKVSYDLQIFDRWNLQTSTLPGEIFPSTTLRINHHPLAVMRRSGYVALSTTAGVSLLSMVDRGGERSPWIVWPHPVTGREFFLEGPPVDRIFLFTSQGKRIPLQVTPMGQRLRIQLLTPPIRGPYWLVVEQDRIRHTQVILFSP